MKKQNEGERGGQQEHTLRRADNWVRLFVVRRQNFIYLLLIIIGVQFLLRSLFGSPTLAGEGVAFIMVGCVGLVMSFTTMDIGKGIRDAAHDEGDMTRTVVREGLDDLAEHLGTLDDHLGSKIDTLDDHLGSKIDTLDEHLGTLDDHLGTLDDHLGSKIDTLGEHLGSKIDRLNENIEAMSADNRAFFRQMLEAQNRILDKQS